MLTRLEITGFRGHERRTLDGLGRVNLLVGPNNAGKTAVLDAVELLLRDGHPQVLKEQAIARGGSAVSGQQLPATVRHLFHGHALGETARFTVAAQGSPERTINVEFADRYTDTQVPDTAMVTVTRDELQPFTCGVGYLQVATDVRPPARACKVERVDPGPPDGAVLHRLWASIVGNPEEDLVVEALKLVDPLLQRVVFAPEANGSGRGPIFVRRSNEVGRVPLETMGEGVRRMLALTIRLVCARGGTLLVDEIDDGLHFRVMTGLWGFLVREARRLDVQVFATTHSADCVNALGWIHRTTSERLDDVAVFRLDATQPVAAHFTPGDIDDAIELRMDLR